MESKDKIYELRKKIDGCDDKMLALLVMRFAVAKEIGEIIFASSL
ncbi:MAG: chorismate mutase [Candidatus Neomarinimicrobiota bacterium]|nr:chorismate mutase [Candidatus Neomarinimicrobiota bacterium]